MFLLSRQQAVWLLGASIVASFMISLYSYFGLHREPWDAAGGFFFTWFFGLLVTRLFVRVEE